METKAHGFLLRGIEIIGNSSMQHAESATLCVCSLAAVEAGFENMREGGAKWRPTPRRQIRNRSRNAAVWKSVSQHNERISTLSHSTLIDWEPLRSGPMA